MHEWRKRESVRGTEEVEKGIDGGAGIESERA